MFWNDSINLPSGDACCCDIISGLADCWDTSVVSWNAKKACFSACSWVIPSFIRALTLFLKKVAPPEAIAKLSAICVGKKPFLSIQAIAALALFSAPATAADNSASLIPLWLPDLLCFKYGELNNIEKSFQYCFWLANAIAALAGLLKLQLI